MEAINIEIATRAPNKTFNYQKIKAVKENQLGLGNIKPKTIIIPKIIINTNEIMASHLMTPIGPEDIVFSK